MKYAFPAIIPAVIDRVYCKIAVWWARLRSPVLCWLWGVKAGANVFFQGTTYIRTRGSGIKIGNNVVFNSLSRSNLVGLMNPTILDTRMGGKIAIGSNCGFSSTVISSMSCISIGDNVLVGGNVRIFDHDFHSVERRNRCSPDDRQYVRSKPVVIGDGVFIGTNAIILKGTKIGEGAIVSAGSVVVGLDVPPNSIVRGNPASIVCFLTK